MRISLSGLHKNDYRALKARDCRGRPPQARGLTCQVAQLRARSWDKTGDEREEASMKRKLLVFAGIAATAVALTGVAAAASAPTAKTGSATLVKLHSALLHGTVNPDGASTTYFFQWGLTTSYGTNGAPVSAGSGVKALGISRSATGLVQGTTYHYRL